MLLEVINYKDRETESSGNDAIDEKVIRYYFRGIFQAEKLEKIPAIADIQSSLQLYNVSCLRWQE